MSLAKAKAYDRLTEALANTHANQSFVATALNIAVHNGLGLKITSALYDNLTSGRVKLIDNFALTKIENSEYVFNTPEGIQVPPIDSSPGGSLYEAAAAQLSIPKTVLKNALAAAPAVLITQGLPPALALCNYRTPPTTPHRLFDGSAPLAPNLSKLHAPPKPNASKSKPQGKVKKPKSHWLEACRVIVDHFSKALNDAVSGSTKAYISPTKYAELAAIYEACLDKFDEYGCNQAAHSLAVRWVWAKIDLTSQHRSRIQVQTAQTYLSQVLSNYLDYSDECDDLSTWDTEDFEELLLTVLPTKSLKKFKAGRINDFLKFVANETGNSSLEPIFSDEAPLSRKHALLTPNELEPLVKHLAQGSGQERTAAVAITVAFYGGLRQIELHNLKVRDIVIDDEDFRVIIKRSKTSSGKRTVLLNAFAPDYAKDLILDHAFLRSELSSDKKSALNAPLLDFGVEEYEARRYLNNLLKSAYGNEYTMHTLRHSFASLTLLRWASLKLGYYPHDLVPSLSSARSDGELERLLWGYRQDNIRQIAPHDLLHIAQQLGHADINTMLIYYAHSMPLITAQFNKNDTNSEL